MPERTQPAQEPRNRHESSALAALRTRTRKTPRRPEQTRRLQTRNQFRQPNPLLHHAAVPAHKRPSHQSRARRRPKSPGWRPRPLHPRLPPLPPRQRLARSGVVAFDFVAPGPAKRNRAAVAFAVALESVAAGPVKRDRAAVAFEVAFESVAAACFL